MTQLNWRGLPVHTVDMWDDWPLSLEKYQEMVDTWDTLREIVEAQLGDMGLVLQLMEYSTRAERMAQTQRDAGEDI